MWQVIYQIIWPILVPIALLRLWIKSFKNPDYRKGFAQRLGFGLPKTERPIVIFHLVSVGETLAAVDLIKRFQRKFPQFQLLITSTTPTGKQRVQKAFGDSVLSCYLPFDSYFVQKRFIATIQPKLVVLMETELWPNLIAQCRQQNIPSVLINARLSERSKRGYQKFASLTSKMLNALSLICVQNDQDAERFSELGIEQRKLKVTGSIKFDIEVSQADQQLSEQFANQWQIQNRFVWLAASTHPSEESQLIQVHKRLLEQVPNALLILVPRHLERFEEVSQLAASQLKTVRRSQHNSVIADDVKLVVGDSMGELMALFSLADAAFIGGSLIAHGGHNPLEAIAANTAVISGPHIFNFSFVYQALENSQAVIIEDDITPISNALQRFAQDSVYLTEMTERAVGVLSQWQGATELTLSELERILQEYNI